MMRQYRWKGGTDPRNVPPGPIAIHRARLYAAGHSIEAISRRETVSLAAIRQSILRVAAHYPGLPVHAYLSHKDPTAVRADRFAMALVLTAYEVEPRVTP